VICQVSKVATAVLEQLAQELSQLRGSNEPGSLAEWQSADSPFTHSFPEETQRGSCFAGERRIEVAGIDRAFRPLRKSTEP
jgi:hypothetical protein